MTGQIVIRSSPVALARRKPVLAGTLTPARSPATTATPTPPRRRSRKSSANVGEVAGGTAAGCLVVCCCCPCVLVEFLFLAVYKVPATVLRRIYRKKIAAKRMKKKGGGGIVKQAVEGSGVGETTHHHCGNCDELTDVDLKEFEKVKVSIDGSAEAIELDRQMWAQFQNSGFGRSLSQRHNS